MSKIEVDVPEVDAIFLRRKDKRQRKVRKPPQKVVTNRQLKAAALMPYAKNKSEALRMAGYSESYIKSGTYRRSGFLALVDAFYTNEMVMGYQDALMNATDVQTITISSPVPEATLKKDIEEAGGKYLGFRRQNTGGILVIFLAPNWRTRADGLDKLYKLKGLYAPQEMDLGVRRPYAEMSDEELDASIKEGETKFKK